MKFALANMQDREGGYVVIHGLQPLSEFATGHGNQPAPKENPLAAAYTVLFPYGIGAIEVMRQHTVGFEEHFEHDALAISSLTVADLKEAVKEEAAHMPISNPHIKLLCKHVFTSHGHFLSQASYCGQIWGTCLHLHGPSLWVTINPCNIHDPIVQILAVLTKLSNIAQDPYTAEKYFFFIINTILHTLFGINAMKDHVHTHMGLLGNLSAFFGVVEAQG
ncbi:hypothetical protein PAXRUDRAFT_36834 [Paxillus rubicundulus Ve08.2h10]|uniref:Helitron helicase-like domain-containing protein n=1 Tax=Paxillus rubicundulus Ve08.2h10 TaxID=930991 RepID=A0A0D0CP84_9AGAM|nr:hypothetical protein PAXRUDRAFT_36834 [Paxillus rubicundulus Ve08.2h10]